MFGLIEWFRDDDGWQFPDGRRGEFVGLVIVLPVAVWYVQRTVGSHSILEWPIALVAGVYCGFVYVAYVRDRVRTHRSGKAGTVVSIGLAAFSIGSLDSIGLAEPAVVLLGSATVTVLVVYLIRLCSPVHDGLQPPRRGVEPPPADS